MLKWAYETKCKLAQKWQNFERTSTSHRRRHTYRTHQKLLLIQSESTVQGKKWLDTLFNEILTQNRWLHSKCLSSQFWKKNCGIVSVRWNSYSSTVSQPNQRINEKIKDMRDSEPKKNKRAGKRRIVINENGEAKIVVMVCWWNKMKNIWREKKNKRRQKKKLCIFRKEKV